MTVKVDDAYIRESILEPSRKITVGFEQTMMPQMAVTDEEINQIIAYMKTL